MTMTTDTAAQNFVIAPPAVSSVAIAGTEARFPIRRIFCVGRNYAAHAREMGKDPDRDPPFFFTKPADSVVDNGAAVPYPPLTRNFHYEIELVLAIGKGGFNIPASKALDHVYGYAVGIDLTRRDLQLAARDAGRPGDDQVHAIDLAFRAAPADGGALDRAIGAVAVVGEHGQAADRPPERAEYLHRLSATYS